MFVVCNFKKINWEQVEFDEGKSFLPFLVVSHILSETVTFLTALSPLNSSEAQYRSNRHSRLVLLIKVNGPKDRDELP